jgi:hypothetical protein
VRDFAGIGEARIELPPEGVTIVCGPNERGKSSLLRAIEVLFAEYDSSTKAAVRALKPVGRDASPYVELELTTGPYHLVYAKQWDAGRRTELRVLAPRPESLTGREAHDRVREILAETLDEALLRALWYEQGSAVTQAALGESLSLQRALDGASAGVLGGDTEATVWQRVRAEWERYFTPSRGQPVAQRADLARELAEAECRFEQAEQELAEVDRDAEAVAALDAELERLRLRKEGQAVDRDELERAWAVVEALTREVDTLAARAQAAELERRRWEDAVGSRAQQVAGFERARAARAALEEDAAREVPALERTRRGRDESVAARDRARAAREAADAALRVANADLQDFRDRGELHRLEERQRVVREQEAVRARAQAFVEGCRVTDDALVAIRVAHERSLQARAAASGDRPRVRVHALGDVTVAPVPGTPDVLAAGEHWEVTVAESLEVTVGDRTVGDLVRIEVEAGGAGRRSEHEAERAGAELVALLRDHLVDPPTFEVAVELNRRRADAVATMHQADGAIELALQGFTPAGMDAFVEQVRERVERHPTWRVEVGATGPLPTSYEEAMSEVSTRSERVDDAARAAREREAEAEEAERAWRELEDSAIGRSTRLADARQAVADAEATLELARKELTDEELALRLEDATERAAGARGEHEAKRAQLDAASPDAARMLLDNARQAVERTERELADLAERRAGLVARIQFVAEKGLYDLRERAFGRVEELRREKDRADERAAAADLLHHVLGEERAAAQRTYTAPFKAELDRLAAVVFGAGTTVEVSHETLRIESRTTARGSAVGGVGVGSAVGGVGVGSAVGGVTVPFASLSVGAKEQLCVLSRLAAARLVEPRDGEGVPVVFDDALGNSDRERLKRLCAVLGECGRDLQVIVLTCEPERFAYVGNAVQIAL